jgi:hypothetical protein
VGISVKGGAAISQEVRPEAKTATDSQKGDIIVLSLATQKAEKRMMMV